MEFPVKVVPSFVTSGSSAGVGTGQHPLQEFRDCSACTKSCSRSCEIQVWNMVAASSRTDFD